MMAVPVKEKGTHQRPFFFLAFGQRDHLGVVTISLNLVVIHQSIVITFDAITFHLVGRKRHVIQCLRVEENRLVIALIWQTDQTGLRVAVVNAGIFED